MLVAIKGRCQCGLRFELVSLATYGVYDGLGDLNGCRGCQEEEAFAVRPGVPGRGGGCSTSALLLLTSSLMPYALLHRLCPYLPVFPVLLVEESSSPPTMPSVGKPV